MATTTLVKGARASRSTVTLKLLMAVSGIIWIAFLLMHMYGNLKAFSGHDAYNHYAEHIRELMVPLLPRYGFLWVQRVVLLLALVVHVSSAVALWRRAGRARSTRYVMKKNIASSLSSRTMRWGGLAILAFLIWHLINFTFGKVNVQGGPTDDEFNLLVDSFDTWWLTLIYLVAMFALGMHLHHGTWSAAQTLGLTTTARARANAKSLGWALAVVIAGGFSIVPIAILTGVISK